VNADADAQNEVAKAKRGPLLGEREAAVGFVLLGLLLVLGPLIWLGVSANGEPRSKEVVTTEPVGKEATGTKTTSETGYAETLIVALVGTGALLIIVGAFYGRLKEIKLPGGAGILLDEEAVAAATSVAQKTAREDVEKASMPEAEQNLAAQVAVTLVLPELLKAAAGTKVVSAEAIGRAAGAKAAQQMLNQT
jgi:hypothetical protein